MWEPWRTKAGQWASSLRTMVQSEKGRMNLLVLAGLIGMMLLCISEWIPNDAAAAEPADTYRDQNTSTAETRAKSYADDMETQLKELVEAVEGAGRCRVMVTLSSGEETVYATDTEQGDTSSRSEHVLLGEEALVERVQSPEIQGVVVLCEGGNDATVKNTITEMVRALTGIGANHITVTKMVAAQQ